MGLDMYLTRCSREVAPYRNNDLEEIKEKCPVLYNRLKPYIVKQGTESIFTWDSLEEEVGYWRKANQIHNWFVQNVQKGNDDCDSYEVTKEQLERLLSICKEVINKTDLAEGKIINGQRMTDHGWQNIYEDGKVIINTSLAEKLLPTINGFFFGSTEYDEYYINDLKDTVEIIENVLESTDFFKQAIFYCSSW